MAGRFFTEHSCANSLRIVARLVAPGLDTPIEIADVFFVLKC
jgi:hypothetical protein